MSCLTSDIIRKNRKISQNVVHYSVLSLDEHILKTGLYWSIGKTLARCYNSHCKWLICCNKKQTIVANHFNHMVTPSYATTLTSTTYVYNVRHFANMLEILVDNYNNSLTVHKLADNGHAGLKLY